MSKKASKTDVTDASEVTKHDETDDTTFYICNVKVRHDGVEYQVDSEVGLTDDQAKSLLVCGAIKAK